MLARYPGARVRGWGTLLSGCMVESVAFGGYGVGDGCCKGVGMAVPGWPNTFGYNMFLVPFDQWIGKYGIFEEHSHRLMASFVGLLTKRATGLVVSRSYASRCLYGKVRRAESGSEL